MEEAERIEFYYDKYIEEAEKLCDNAGLAPSTKKGKISALAKIFSQLRTSTPEGFKHWLDTYISERTGKPLGPHGKNSILRR